jgi:ATP-dependent Clp protease ATP-binding subunit ClpX
MRRALTEPKNAIVRQQIELFRRDGIELVITDAALDAVVDTASKMKTGVRALKSLIKRMSSRARYELSGDKAIKSIELGPETLDDPDAYKTTRHFAATTRKKDDDPGLAEAV